MNAETTKKVFPLDLTKSTEELKKLITEHPDYPIVVLAGEYANAGDYAWMYCNSISFSVEEILDCETPYESETVCTDRDDFYDRLEEWLWDEMEDNDITPQITEEEFLEALKKEEEKYEPYWKKVIAIYADN